MFIIPLLLCNISPNRQSRSDRLFLMHLHTIIQEHLTNDALNVCMLCHETGISGTQLRRKMLALTGKSPNQYIRYRRLQEAARLIHEEELNVSEAAYQAGFNSMSYFSKCFRKMFGMRPSEYHYKILNSTQI